MIFHKKAKHERSSNHRTAISRSVRTSQGTLPPVPNRDVGALLLLRHAGTAGALPHQGTLPGRRPGVRYLRCLHGTGLHGTGAGGTPGRQHPGLPHCGNAGSGVDGHRRVPDPGRQPELALRGHGDHHRGQRLFQGQHIKPGGQALLCRRPASRLRLHHLLHRCQRGGIACHAGRRLGGRALRLQIWLRTRRHRHAAGIVDLRRGTEVLQGGGASATTGEAARESARAAHAAAAHHTALLPDHPAALPPRHLQRRHGHPALPHLPLRGIYPHA